MTSTRERRFERGFTLIEALIAAALLTAAIASLALLVVQSTARSLRAQRSVVASTLAQAKLEELRAADLRFDSAGAPVTSAVLAPVLTNTLVDESPEHVDVLDRFGNATTDVGTEVYRRRWSVMTVTADPDTLTLAVCVFAVDSRWQGGADACVWTSRTRQP